MAESYGGFQKYHSRNPLQRRLIERFFRKISSIFRELPPGPFCEVGCGEGFALRRLLDLGALGGAAITAVDIDPGKLEHAERLVPGAAFKKASAYQLPFTEKQFRVVAMLEVLEHLEAPEKALREASRAGEYVVVSVPHEPWFRAANFFRGKHWPRWGNDPEHVQWWGKRSFRRMLDPYGTVLRFETSFPWMIALLKTGHGSRAASHD